MQPPIPPMNTEKLSQLMDGDWHELNPSECIAGICGDDALRSKWARYHLIRDALKNEPVHSDLTLVSRICAAVDDEPVYSNITPFSPGGTAQTSSGGASAQSGDDSSVKPVTDVLPVTDASLATAADTHPLSANAPTIERDRTSWFGTGLTGFAVAASVALITVVGMNVWQGQAGESDDVSVVASRAISGIDGTDAFSRQPAGAPLPVVEFVANTGSYWVSPDTAERVNNEKKLNMFLSQHIENSPTSSREGLLPYSRLVGYDEQQSAR